MLPLNKLPFIVATGITDKSVQTLSTSADISYSHREGPLSHVEQERLGAAFTSAQAWCISFSFNGSCGSVDA